MDIKLNQTKEKEFDIYKVKNIIYLILRSIAITNSILIIGLVKEYKILYLIIVLLIYINITLLIKVILNNFRTVTLWRVLDNFIDKIENQDITIENILEEFKAFKNIMGKTYGEISDDIKEIVVNINKSIKNSKKNERMNLLLVSRVTDKLDKPLNCIIENVEKLKDSEENEEEILLSLSKKSNSLKKLIDELFESAKVASGDIHLEMNDIEIVSLLRQALIEYKEEIDESNIIFKVNIPKEKILVKCNGEKMWRVFGIFIENALKHSLDNSRVYINLEKSNEIVNVGFKNTSKRELNISPKNLDEIIENNDDNVSGLNLEIARNLVLIQNGSFDLDIEADLFKVNVSFSVIEEKGEDIND
ncbi:sensor histidine kinase [Clostridium sp. D53t1_180928_C8]|uniref:sensor histidine kinase n=1 Tax=Clostridium sp. D53t1_180928_C8 TaxID=2787101 RepID=UPI0018AA5A4E|nr:sensor histidine kinase [Clostridium sp. D53t1_180928_C8]